MGGLKRWAASSRTPNGMSTAAHKMETAIDISGSQVAPHFRNVRPQQATAAMGSPACSYAPHTAIPTPHRRLFPKHLLTPRPPGPHVEHHQVAGLRPAQVHVGRGLHQPLLDCARVGAPFPHQLALHHEPALAAIPLWPDDQQLHPPAPERVLPLDAAPAGT